MVKKFFAPSEGVQIRDGPPAESGKDQLASSARASAASFTAVRSTRVRSAWDGGTITWVIRSATRFRSGSMKK